MSNKKVSTPENSSMSRDGKEMRELEETMEHVESNKETKEKGNVPDPIQNKKENE
ncbi:hypothetical protein LCL95_06780 [Bacillus timonensis]|nr:hypothetical protein [Bacillus timonensis]